MDWEELKNKGTAELKEIIAQERESLLNLRSETHTLKQVHKIKLAKRIVARALTLLKQREPAVAQKKS